jgi:ankyrin repeat protein
LQNEVVKILLENDANVNLATADNWTPVHDAARGGHVPVLRTLMAANADMQVNFEE